MSHTTRWICLLMCMHVIDIHGPKSILSFKISIRACVSMCMCQVNITYITECGAAQIQTHAHKNTSTHANYVIVKHTPKIQNLCSHEFVLTIWYVNVLENMGHRPSIFLIVRPFVCLFFFSVRFMCERSIWCFQCVDAVHHVCARKGPDWYLSKFSIRSLSKNSADQRNDEWADDRNIFFVVNSISATFTLKLRYSHMRTTANTNSNFFIENVQSPWKYMLASLERKKSPFAMWFRWN